MHNIVGENYTENGIYRNMDCELRIIVPRVVVDNT